MHFRLKEYLRNNSLIYSLIIHFLIVVAFLILYLGRENISKSENVNFEVVERFVVETMAKPDVTKIKKRVKKTTNNKSRKVFGLSRKSLTNDQSVKVKKGNTVAKTPDSKKLKKSDQDSLPIPADEFLITSMPAVISEIRPIYPDVAKKSGLQGKVIFEILIDENGNVRDAILIKSLSESLDNSARDAIMRFKFRPAKMDDKSVAVKIKYAINFILEE